MRKWLWLIVLLGLASMAVAAGIYIRGTSAPDFVIDYDNTGAGANTSLVFERGSSGTDASIAWDETSDTFSLSHPITDLQVIGPYQDVTAYGAVGDGIEDDTAAIQAACDAGGIVFFPAGTYKITSTITIYTKTSLLGAHGYQSIISCTTLDDTAILVTNDPEDTLTRLTNFIENLYFIGSQTNSSDIGLFLYDTSMTEVRNCYFRQFGQYGLRMSTTVGCTLQNVHFYNATLKLITSNFCVTAENIEIRGNRYPALQDCYDSTFRMLVIEGMNNVAYALYLNDMYRVSIENIYLEANTVSGSRTIVLAEGCENLRFIDCNFTTATGATDLFYTGAYLHQRYIHFEGCKFGGKVTGYPNDVFYFDGCVIYYSDLPANAVVKNPRPVGRSGGMDYAILRDPTVQVLSAGERLGLSTIAYSSGLRNTVVADSDFTADHYLTAESGTPTLVQETAVGYDDLYCASIASSGGACVAYFDKAHLWGAGALTTSSIMAVFMIKADAEREVTLTWENVYNGSDKADDSSSVHATTQWRQVFFRNRSLFSLDAADATDTLKIKFGIDAGKIYIDRLHIVVQRNSIPPTFIDEYQYVPVGDAKVASIAALNIGTKRNHWVVTGTTDITSIAAACAVPERVVYFEFADVLTVTHGNNIYMAESTSFTTIAGSTLVMMCDADSDWHEISRATIDKRYNVMDYGATGDGVTDDRTAVQVAIDAADGASGGMVYFPPGTYKISSAIDIKDNVSLEGDGETSIVYVPTGNSYIAATGTASGVPLTLAANALGQQFDITLNDASSLSEGDWIRIYSDDAFDGSATQKQSELGKIKTIAGNVLTMISSLATTYTTGNSASVEKITSMVGDITISNLRFLGGGAAENQIGCDFTYCRNVRIENSSFFDFNHMAMAFRSCVNVSIDKATIDNCLRAGYGYGIGVYDSSRGFRVSNSFFTQCRHAITTGGTVNGVQRNVVIDSNNFLGSGLYMVGQIGTHHTSEDLVVSNNTCVGDLLISIESPKTTIIGNTAKSGTIANGAVISIGTDGKKCLIANNYLEVGGMAGIHGFSAKLQDVIIRGNTIRKLATAAATSYGVYITYGYDNLVIDGNKTDGFTYGIYSRNQNAIADSTNMQIANNVILNSTTAGIASHAQDFDNIGVSICNNIIDTVTTYGIIVYDENGGAGYNDRIQINNNKISNAGTGLYITHYTDNFMAKANQTYACTNTAQVVGANLGQGSVGEAVRTTSSLDLSGGATDVEAYIASGHCTLVMYEVVYTEASSADAGVNVRIGRYQDGVALDDDYFDVVVSEASKNLGYRKRYYTADLTQSELAPGDALTCGTAGGKVGTGEVLLVLYVVESTE